MLTPYKKGDRLTAADFNAIAKSATSPTRVTASGGLQVTNTAAGLHISGKADSGRGGSPIRTVAVTRDPQTGDAFVRVMRIAYAAFPPVPCNVSGTVTTCHMAFVGNEWNVLPEYGKTAQNYKDAYWNRTAKPQPDYTTRLFKARREEGYWVLDFPAKASGSMRLGVVTVASTAGLSSVTVQPVKLTGAGPPPTFGADGAAVSALCWANSNSIDYLGHISTVGSGTAAYVLLVTLGDTEYVFPTYVLYNAQPTSGVPRGDCAVT